MGKGRTQAQEGARATARQGGPSEDPDEPGLDIALWLDAATAGNAGDRRRGQERLWALEEAYGRQHQYQVGFDSQWVWAKLEATATSKDWIAEVGRLKLEDLLDRLFGCRCHWHDEVLDHGEDRDACEAQVWELEGGGIEERTWLNPRPPVTPLAAEDARPVTTLIAPEAVDLLPTAGAVHCERCSGPANATARVINEGWVVAIHDGCALEDDLDVPDAAEAPPIGQWGRDRFCHDCNTPVAYPVWVERGYGEVTVHLACLANGDQVWMKSYRLALTAARRSRAAGVQ